MTDLAVEVHDLGKRYVLGERQTLRSLRDSLGSVAGKLLRRAESGSSRPTIWALRNVSFDLETGGALAIIGHNGAGKSTLLKILSRITSPTEGRVRIHGRAGALLEVGTGFHPELTGRENIYLNGAVLGMSKAEIARKFDEIIDFAELPTFVDTPVKRYSSGMQMRLAFAVAAHLEPEILIIDEVLAVGDAAFQRKCLGRMGAVASEGRTVLFVSHNLTAVRTLCPRAILLQSGRVVFDGPSEVAIDRYLQGEDVESDCVDLKSAARGAEDQEGRIRFTSITVTGDSEGAVRVGDPLSLIISFELLAPLRDVTVKLNVLSLDETLIGQSVTTHCYPPVGNMQAGRYRIEATIDSNPFQPGRYRLGLSASDARRLQDYIPRAATVEIVESAAGLESPWFAGPGGYVRVPVRWSMPAPDVHGAVRS